MEMKQQKVSQKDEFGNFVRKTQNMANQLRQFCSLNRNMKLKHLITCYGVYKAKKKYCRMFVYF